MARIRILNAQGEYEELPLMRGEKGEKGEKGEDGSIDEATLQAIDENINKKTKVIIYRIEE